MARSVCDQLLRTDRRGRSQMSNRRTVGTELTATTSRPVRGQSIESGCRAECGSHIVAYYAAAFSRLSFAFCAITPNAAGS
jgi:hypothetical protein